MAGITKKTPEEQAHKLFWITMACVVSFSGLAYIFVIKGAL